MKRKGSIKVDLIVQTIMRNQGLEHPYQHVMIKKAWMELNPLITKHTREVYIQGDILYVKLTSAALRQELMMGRDDLVRRLNNEVRAKVIKDIIFR
ncbi:MAG TPA: DUF721 domain-containing protein [Bacteroidaceae bacterium]|nr:DUF721 domain-containing protein [Bacteroidaceae bacterium]